MECPLSESFLERLPKDNPYQICRFCVKETNDLLEIQQVSDFRILYLNLMNVEVRVYLWLFSGLLIIFNKIQ